MSAPTPAPTATEEDPFGGGGGAFPTPALRYLGTQVRFVNVYAGQPAGAAPGAIDIYSGFVQENSVPIATVPYGQVSTYVDPGVQDESGNANLYWYLPGDRTEAGRIGGQSGTWTGKERLTIVIGTGQNERTGGGRFAQWRVNDDAPTGDALVSPRPGKATVEISGHGLDNVYPEDLTWVAGDGKGGCLPAARADPSEPSSVLVVPGTSEHLAEVAPGASEITLHDAPAGVPAECDSEPKARFPIQVTPDSRNLLVLYAPNAEAPIQALLVTFPS